jgi:NitT/TauT family transport system substrate-binding protein
MIKGGDFMKKINKVLSVLASGVTLTTLISACNSSNTSTNSQQSGSTNNSGGSQQVVKVAMDEPSPSLAGIVLADKMGYFKDEGIQIKPVNFSSGADTLTGLASNQVDVAGSLISAYSFNAVKQGLNISIVADQGRDNPGKGYFELVLRKDIADKVKDYSQLKGLTLGIVSKGNINELMLDKALEKGGLTENDINLKVVDDFSDFNTALANKAVDGAMQIEPNINLGISQNVLVPFKDPSDYAPNEEISTIMYSPDFQKNKDLATRFMIAYLKGVRALDSAYIYGSVNKDQVGKIMSDYLKTSTSALDKMNMPLLDPNGYVDPKAVQSDEDWYMKGGTVKQEVPADQVVNPEFAQAAVKKIGEYKKP